jgi:hypothetical protein
VGCARVRRGGEGTQFTCFTSTKVRILTRLELKAAAPHLDWPAVAGLFDTPRFQVETCEGLVLLLDALQLALGT